MKKAVLRAGAGIVGTLFLLIILAVAVFFQELRSLASLRKIDDYPMYGMTYYGDYGFEEFLAAGAQSDADIEAFVTKRLLKGLPVQLGTTGDACTAFVTRNEKGEVLFGRNFDFHYAPSLQVRTKPGNGYASISTVNLTFAGYSADRLPDGLSFDSFLTLAAPFLPFDGVNEKGLAIALLAVPEAQTPNDPEKVTLNTTATIRLVLDYAATVDEAVALMKNYNIYFSGNIGCHFFIADALGKSVLVEYWDNAMQIVPAKESYQIASNFIAFHGLNIGEGFTEFERYDAVQQRIEQNNQILTEEQAIDLLAKIGIYGPDGEDKLEWSVIYNLTTLDCTIFANRNAGHIIRSRLE